MPDSALTCEYCKRLPATHLLVTDWRFYSRTERRMSVICGPCADHGMPAIRHHAAGAWLYTLAAVVQGVADA